MLDGDPAPPPQKEGGAPSQSFGPFLLWPNGWVHQDATRYGGRPQPRGFCVRWRPCPQQGGGAPLKFSAQFYCGQTAGCINMPLVMEVGLSPGDLVLDGDPAHSAKSGGAPQFLAHVYCGQTAAWIKMLFGTEVHLGLRDIVLDGDPAAPPLKGHSPPISPMSIVATIANLSYC